MKNFRRFSVISNSAMFSIILGASVMLVGCEKKEEDKTAKFILPEYMKDCKISELTSSFNERITVTYCPHADVSTTYKSGKSSSHSAVIIEKDNTRPMTPEEYAEHYNRTNK